MVTEKTSAGVFQGTFVVAVIPTYRRRMELERLLGSLERCGPALGGIVVIDNGNEDAVRQLARSRKKEVIYQPSELNPGPGAAWKAGTEVAMHHFADRLTHIMTLDDDVVIEPDVLEQLLLGMEQSKAGAAVPLICDAKEVVGALSVPEPVDPRLRRVIRRVRTREDSARLLGNIPLEICWCIGPCLLLAKETIRKAGMHRDDFFILGEDVEYSIRVGSCTRMVVVPWVFVPHLPPPTVPHEQAGLRDYLKFCALLQNLTYIALRLPQSRHLWRYLPGNFRRFFKTFGWSSLTLRDALVCFADGFLRGQPAGHEKSARFRAKITARHKKITQKKPCT